MKFGKSHYLVGFFLFIISFLIYLFTLGPSILPYRDSGELISVSYTLGIAHPPGYPLYTLLGKLFTFFPLGNVAYRMNLMSAFFASLTVMLLYFIILRVLVGNGDKPLGGQSPFPKAGNYNLGALIPAIVGSLMYAFSYAFWGLALVAEMYTLDTFFIALLILILLIWRDSKTWGKFYLFAFLAGLCLCNRLTIILCAPVFLYFIWEIQKEKNTKLPFTAPFFYSMGFFLLGLSVYLYLPLRSVQNPVIDWGDPQTMIRFINVITRKAYGHALDRVAEQYQLKEVLIPQLKVYVSSLITQFSIPGFFLGLFGVYFSLKKYSKSGIFFLLFFLLSGPVFIALSKMPLNPHALAIIEASYIVPNLIFAIWIGFGIKAILDKSLMLASVGRWSLIAIISFVPVIPLAVHFHQNNKSQNYFAYDYGENILKSMENNSILIMRKDVQLFTLWFFKYVEGKRQDVKIIAQGLFGAKWYQNQLRRRFKDLVIPDRALFSSSEDCLKEFIKKNMEKFPVYTTFDLEAGEGFYDDFQKGNVGLLRRFLPKGATIDKRIAYDNLWRFYNYRNKYDAELYKDFFVKDTIEKYATSHDKLGVGYFGERQYNKATREFKRAIQLKFNFSQSYYNLGITNFYQGFLDKAEDNYKKAIYYYRKALTREELRKYIEPEQAKVHNNLGALYEKKRNPKDAIGEYQIAIRLDPNFDEPHYNLGVVYWKQGRWKDVVREFERAIEINPGHINARKFLLLARKKIKE
ncbi:DUF2723 domain-containing protein [bacterium]|nr:DUF2723 domain-containing protein [bacterium]